MLNIVWGDDEHTAADGPYNRLLKARKWIYLLAVVAILHSYGGISFSAVYELTKHVVRVPPWLASNAMIAGLAVLAVQYTFLLVQTVVAYSEILSARIKPSAAVAQQLALVANMRQNLHTTKKQLADNAVRSLPERMALSGTRIESLQAEAYELERQRADREIDLQRDEAALNEMMKNDPSKKWVFLASEYGIDIARGLLPLVAAFGGLWQLIVLHPGH